MPDCETICDVVLDLKCEKCHFNGLCHTNGNVSHLKVMRCIEQHGMGAPSDDTAYAALFSEPASMPSEPLPQGPYSSPKLG